MPEGRDKKRQDALKVGNMGGGVRARDARLQGPSTGEVRPGEAQRRVDSTGEVRNQDALRKGTLPIHPTRYHPARDPHVIYEVLQPEAITNSFRKQLPLLFGDPDEIERKRAKQEAEWRAKVHAEAQETIGREVRDRTHQHNLGEAKFKRDHRYRDYMGEYQYGKVRPEPRFFNDDPITHGNAWEQIDQSVRARYESHKDYLSVRGAKEDQRLKYTTSTIPPRRMDRDLYWRRSSQPPRIIGNEVGGVDGVHSAGDTYPYTREGNTDGDTVFDAQEAAISQETARIFNEYKKWKQSTPGWETKTFEFYDRLNPGPARPLYIGPSRQD